MKSEPFLTIVIPVYNQERFIAECFDSLEQQGDLSDVEILLMDGGSKDGTLKIVEKYRHLLDRVVSGPDAGQSDAIDKGFRGARGRYLTWLNSDDVLLPGAVSSMRSCLAKNPEIDWLVGDLVLLGANGCVTSAHRAGACIYGKFLRFVHTYSPSSLFRRELYESVGGLDLSFHYRMDGELWWRFASAGSRYVRASQHWWGFRQHEGSKTSAHLFEVALAEEVNRSLEDIEASELYIRHGFGAGGYQEISSVAFARISRLPEIALQTVDSLVNRGRHWSRFRRVQL